MKKVMEARFPIPPSGVVENANGEAVNAIDLNMGLADDEAASCFLGGLNADDTGEEWPEVDSWTEDFWTEIEGDELVVEVTVRWEEVS